MQVNLLPVFYTKPNFNKPKKQLLQNQKSINFEGKPYALPQIAVKTAYDAMLLYGFLKLGNYLDSSDDDICPEYKEIRDENLSFLDKLKTDDDKKGFIEHYKELTGFPNLKLVSEKIEKEFILGIKKSSLGINGAECLAAGYDGTCSVGKRKAFPGSDLDKSFIILSGVRNPIEDDNILNHFKYNLWNNIDQRLLSFNHDISFPSVYTISQVENCMDKINEKLNGIKFNENHLKNLVEQEYENLEAAAEFNILISKLFKAKVENPGEELSKEDVKNIAYLIESIRDGKYLITSPQIEAFKKKFENTAFYKYSNVAQMNAMKRAVDEGRENKTKILIRENMDKTFEDWSVYKQLEFIKTLIKYSCEDNEKFKEYFSNDRDAKGAYKPLLNILTQGDRKIYNRLEFEAIDNGIKVSYAENASVNIYPGYSDNVLWIDSNNSIAIKQVLRFIDKIKQNDLFTNIDRVQCVQSKDFIEGFYPISFKTFDGKNIMEKIL